MWFFFKIQIDKECPRNKKGRLIENWKQVDVYYVIEDPGAKNETLGKGSLYNEQNLKCYGVRYGKGRSMKITKIRKKWMLIRQSKTRTPNDIIVGNCSGI